MPNQFNSHAKVLKEGNYYIDNSQFVLTAPRVFKKTKEQQIDEATQRIRELNEEIKNLEKELNEKLNMARTDADELMQKAEREAENIIAEAEKTAFEKVKKSLEEKDNIIAQTKEEVKKIIEDAENEKKRILDEAVMEARQIKENAYKEGYEAGKEDGFNSGKEELLSMIERLKSIIYVTLQERERILVHSEHQILNLVLTMVRKIVKKLTHEQENIVIENVKEAISIIRGAMRVYIHVNPQDFEYTTKFKDELIKLIEGMPEVKIFEDPTVDRGGVYIETDLGEIDARISTQLEEIEEKVKFYIPVKVKGKGVEAEGEVEEVHSEELATQ
ncbi:MAG: flagellar assembly protein FliH [Brevinematia bacterium]